MSYSHDTLTERVKLSGYVELQTALHIGTGQSMGATGSDSPVLMSFTGFPIIPGSSFKGVIRSQVEALIRGLEQSDHHQLRCSSKTNNRIICDVVSENYCIPKGDWKEIKPIDVLSRSCDVCKLFGGPYIGGRISIADMTALQETWDPLLIQVRDGVAIDRESRTASPGKKYDFEIVPPGVRFGLELVFDNPEEYEIGLIMRTLKLFNEGFAFIGGKSTRGTGRIKVEIDQITTIDPVKFLKSELGHESGYKKTFGPGEWNHYLLSLNAKLSGPAGGAKSV